MTDNITLPRAVVEEVRSAIRGFYNKYSDEAVHEDAGRAIAALDAALAEQKQKSIDDEAPPPASAIAHLETRRLALLWKELGTMRWMGADEGWDCAIEAVRRRLDEECLRVLAWKKQVEKSEMTTKELLEKLQRLPE
jgi:hypothetical protein